jgi:hypothetical protein
MKRSSLSKPTWAIAWFALALLSACGGGGGSTSEAPIAPPTAQTITFAAPGNQAFAATPVALTATASSGLPVSFSASPSAVCTLNNANLVLAGLGTCTVTASQVGNASYTAAAPVSNSFVVTMGAQTTTFVSPGNQVLGTTPAALMATSTSGLGVVLTSNTPAVCAASGTTLTLLTGGTCAVAASQPGNANYAAAPGVMQSFSVAVNLVAQTINFTPPVNAVLGQAPAALVATASSGLAVSFASITPNVCTVTGTSLSLLTVGTCTVVASQAGNGAFAAAASPQNSFAVAAAAQTITFTSPGNQTLGTAPPALVASSTSGLTVLLTSATPSVCTVNGNALALLTAGTCTLNASQAGNGSFAPAAGVSQSFAVATATQTINFASPGNQTLGTAPPALVASSTSGLAVLLTSATPSICTVSGNVLSLVAAGTCTVNANQAGNASFAPATQVQRSFNVGAAPLTPQTISFASPGNQTLLVAPPALVASATSGLPVSFSSQTPGICTVSGNALTLVAAGACTIAANQAGNASFSAATAVTQTFTVTVAAQSITFAAPPNQTVGTTPPALAANATSGLTVVFASSTPSVCTVSGTTLTLLSAGTCSIDASQAGNGTYLAAPVVSRSFTVAAAVVTINAFANGGFEAAANGAGEFADGWQGNQTVPTRSSAEARSGTFSARIAIPDPGLSGSGLFQNSVDHGQLNTVSPANWGTSPTLTFWIKGNSSETGNFNYALRYLNANGNILNTTTSGARTIWVGNSIRPWTQITLLGVMIPANTTAVFIEFTLAVGPTGVQPVGNCGVDNATGVPRPCDYGQALIYLDDINLPLLP